MMRSMADKIIAFGGQEVIISQEIPPIRVMGTSQVISVGMMNAMRSWATIRFESYSKK